jgi:hypothetical protein
VLLSNQLLQTKPDQTSNGRSVAGMRSREGDEIESPEIADWPAKRLHIGVAPEARATELVSADANTHPDRARQAAISPRMR